MDYWMDQQRGSDPSQDADIKLKECPKCKTAVRQSYRYADVVKQNLADIEAVKRRLLDEEENLEDTIRKLQRQIQTLSRNYPDILYRRNLVESDGPGSENIEEEYELLRVGLRTVRAEHGSSYLKLKQWLRQRRTLAELITIQNQIELLRQMYKVRDKLKSFLARTSLRGNADVEQKSRAAQKETESQIDALETTLMR